VISGRYPLPLKKERLLRGPVLGLLREMIDTGQLTVKTGRGRRPDPEAAIRDEFAADTYEDFLKDHQVSSDDLFRVIGSVTGVGDDSVRQAVTAKRKPKRP
jgi:hypothetical protein